MIFLLSGLNKAQKLHAMVINTQLFSWLRRYLIQLHKEYKSLY